MVSGLLFCIILVQIKENLTLNLSGWKHLCFSTNLVFPFIIFAFLIFDYVIRFSIMLFLQLLDVKDILDLGSFCFI